MSIGYYNIDLFMNKKQYFELYFVFFNTFTAFNQIVENMLF